jgi:hypothetical protein
LGHSVPPQQPAVPGVHVDDAVQWWSAPQTDWPQQSAVLAHACPSARQQRLSVQEYWLQQSLGCVQRAAPAPQQVPSVQASAGPHVTPPQQTLCSAPQPPEASWEPSREASREASVSTSPLAHAAKRTSSRGRRRSGERPSVFMSPAPVSARRAGP